jgi:hypothetical protein
VAAKNAKVDLTGSITRSGRSTDLTSTGSVDFEHRTAQLTRSMPPLGMIEVRLVDRAAYVHLPEPYASQFGGKPWLKLDAATLSSGTSPLGSAASTDPTALINTLQGAGSVTTVGPEDVRGVHTTHYRMTVEIAKAADLQKLTPEQKQQLQQSLGGQPTLPEDVWLDDQGLVHRLAIDITATPPTGTTGTTGTAGGGAPTAVQTKIQMELYDYGQATGPVLAPPADQVTDFGQALGQLGSFGSGGGTTS